jgi:hypothetical protein
LRPADSAVADASQFNLLKLRLLSDPRPEVYRLVGKGNIHLICRKNAHNRSRQNATLPQA